MSQLACLMATIVITVVVWIPLGLMLLSEPRAHARRLIVSAPEVLYSLTHEPDWIGPV